jgi:hypothetical protein
VGQPRGTPPVGKGAKSYEYLSIEVVSPVIVVPVEVGRIFGSRRHNRPSPIGRATHSFIPSSRTRTTMIGRHAASLACLINSLQVSARDITKRMSADASEQLPHSPASLRRINISSRLVLAVLRPLSTRFSRPESTMPLWTCRTSRSTRLSRCRSIRYISADRVRSG